MLLRQKQKVAAVDQAAQPRCQPLFRHFQRRNQFGPQPRAVAGQIGQCEAADGGQFEHGHHAIPNLAHPCTCSSALKPIHSSGSLQSSPNRSYGAMPKTASIWACMTECWYSHSPILSGSRGSSGNSGRFTGAGVVAGGTGVVSSYTRLTIS